MSGTSSCSEDPDVKGTETIGQLNPAAYNPSCSEDPDVKGTETLKINNGGVVNGRVAARIPM